MRASVSSSFSPIIAVSASAVKEEQKSFSGFSQTDAPCRILAENVTFCIAVTH
jgi:hypothetical protein